MRTCGTISAYQGGCRCEPCRTARRDYNRRHYRDYTARKASGAPVRTYPKRRQAKPRRLPPLPSAPLLERIISAYGSDYEVIRVAEALGVELRTMHRWRSGGDVAGELAERVAIALGWHPAAIWGVDWYIRSALEEAA